MKNIIIIFTGILFIILIFGLAFLFTMEIVDPCEDLQECEIYKCQREENIMVNHKIMYDNMYRTCLIEKEFGVTK